MGAFKGSRSHAAGIVWPMLTNAAKNKTTTTYGEIAPKIPTNPLSVGRALGPIQDFCLENRLPPITAIVIGKVSKKPGDGFIAWDVDDLKSAFQIVFDYDWAKVANPYGGFSKSDTIETLGKKLANDPSTGDAIYRLVKGRGIFQKIFRQALIELYGSCAMCELTFEEALEAAHILPWSKCDKGERADIQNGLLLCATHHRLFDNGWIDVSEKYQIKFQDATMASGPYSKIDRALTVQLHDKALSLPTDKTKWPALSYLRRRSANSSN